MSEECFGYDKVELEKKLDLICKKDIEVILEMGIEERFINPKINVRMVNCVIRSVVPKRYIIYCRDDSKRDLGHVSFNLNDITKLKELSMRDNYEGGIYILTIEIGV